MFGFSTTQHKKNQVEILSRPTFTMLHKPAVWATKYTISKMSNVWWTSSAQCHVSGALPVLGWSRPHGARNTSFRSDSLLLSRQTSIYMIRWCTIFQISMSGIHVILFLCQVCVLVVGLLCVAPLVSQLVQSRTHWVTFLCNSSQPVSHKADQLQVMTHLLKYCTIWCYQILHYLVLSVIV